jgi:hypothetical protein
MEGNFSQTNVSAEQALQRLVAGNERFRNGETRLSKQTRADLTSLAAGQVSLRNHTRLQRFACCSRVDFL